MWESTYLFCNDFRLIVGVVLFQIWNLECVEHVYLRSGSLKRVARVETVCRLYLLGIEEFG
jgi:hypothetical protein